MKREQLEQQQSWIYLAFIALGLCLGLLEPEAMAAFGQALWPLLGFLLFATFTQIPLLQITQSLQDTRFMTALLVGNFVVIPALLGVLVVWLPLPPPVLAGILLVLLMPCTDWFVTFAHLGKGDAARAIAATPLLLLVQMAALPAYLWLLLGSEWLRLTLSPALLSAFLSLMVLPLLLAWLTERAAQKFVTIERATRALGWMPVPLLACVVLIIAATQVAQVLALRQLLWQAVLIFVGFLIVAAWLGKALGHLFNLPPTSTRTLVFSFGTRNSFVMLPIALTLPNGWQAAVVIIVCQSLVELLGMVAYLRWVPKRLIPSSGHKKADAYGK
ncbi:arsenic resistance protein [Halomonas sp. CnH100-B]|uniref:arsenic resistance protein n=1 Tax=Halomonas sp. CnH100-B TaxID=2954490 RepID=UPI0020978C24|nr:arsenic resistance protein [Halomonas sp. CnH100-B]MCO7229150.1 arsenic resistance protein [Halomonas sp. CnH100-B]